MCPSTGVETDSNKGPNVKPGTSPSNVLGTQLRCPRRESSTPYSHTVIQGLTREGETPCQSSTQDTVESLPGVILSRNNKCPHSVKHPKGGKGRSGGIEQVD